MDALFQKGSLSNIPFMLHDFWSRDEVRLATSIIGTAFLVYVAVQAALFGYFWIRPSKLQIYCHASSGSWALVTGASDGIGRAFCEELLSRGFNVLLHGRNLEKLERVSKEVSQNYPKRSVDIVVADAGGYDDAYNAVVKKVEKLPGKLTVLINNVGGIPTSPKYVPHADISHDAIDIQLNANIRFPTHLTKELLPVLKDNGPSLILNCGSSGGTMGFPYICTYSATKGFIHSFSSSLKAELVAENIDNVEVIGLIIGNVVSAGNPHRMAFTIDSAECAAASLDRVGCGKALVFPHWKHEVAMWAAAVLPAGVIREMVGKEMRKRTELERKEI